ncbi:hypothetical protein ABT187_45815 [Streptomyces sp. NPDC001817]|uniref:transmembrane-type terpene cyclase n=1 Tax=Streptomyces sp. NPDC001817 TaxID=3154398 RepID=UPI00331F102E
MFAALILVGGTSFAVSYVLMIRRGFLDRTYGVPLVALCAFMVWDVRNALGVYRPWIPMLGAVSGLYVVGHGVIFYQLLRYGPREFSRLSRPTFYCMVAATVGFAFFAVQALDRSLHDTWGIQTSQGTWLAAMVCYPMLCYQRGSLRGLSVPIAALQLVTSIVASVAFLRYLPKDSGVKGSALLTFICLGMSAANLIYLGAVVRLSTGARHAAHAADTVPGQVGEAAPAPGDHPA